MSPVGVSVRPLEPRDLEQLRWLHARTPPAGRIATRPQVWPAEVEDIEANFDGFWVACEVQDGEETLVGAVAVQHGRRPASVPAPAALLRGRPGRLRAMRVAPERQRRGIGRLLTQTVIDWAVEAGYETLILDTTAEQDAAIGLAVAFAPRNRAQLLLRNLLMGLMSLPPVANAVMGRSLRDPITLPPAPAPAA